MTEDAVIFFYLTLHTGDNPLDPHIILTFFFTDSRNSKLLVKKDITMKHTSLRKESPGKNTAQQKQWAPAVHAPPSAWEDHDSHPDSNNWSLLHHDWHRQSSSLQMKQRFIWIHLPSFSTQNIQHVYPEPLYLQSSEFLRQSACSF